MLLSHSDTTDLIPSPLDHTHPWCLDATGESGQPTGRAHRDVDGSGCAVAEAPRQPIEARDCDTPISSASVASISHASYSGEAEWETVLHWGARVTLAKGA